MQLVKSGCISFCLIFFPVSLAKIFCAKSNYVIFCSLFHLSFWVTSHRWSNIIKKKDGTTTFWQNAINHWNKRCKQISVINCIVVMCAKECGFKIDYEWNSCLINSYCQIMWSYFFFSKWIKIGRFIDKVQKKKVLI